MLRSLLVGRKLFRTARVSDQATDDDGEGV